MPGQAGHDVIANDVIANNVIADLIGNLLR